MVTVPLPSAEEAAEPPADLVALLRGFARTDAARASATPAGAYANCLAVSALCGEWLRARGKACGLLHLSGSRQSFGAAVGRWPYYDAAQLEHWTTRVGAWSVDWTSRQFRREAEWPVVERVEALSLRWERVDDWACDRCPELVADVRHQELAPARLHRQHRVLARALAAGRSGAYRDPRHDGTAPLIRLCACPPAGAGAQP